MRTRRGFRWIVLILLLVGTVTQARAQEKPRRPRIGLALAGGSARGLAHVGVLKWLEEHRIPVDYVAGTSMGGLVGGLYATGATAQEIEKFLRDMDWNEVFQGSAPYRTSSFRRKEDMRELPSRVEFGLKGGFQVPTALNPGHGVELALSRFAARYGGLRSFDELPTPFRCVAADLVDGKEVVFQDGDLVTALRATMSIPVVFAPTRLGDRVLVDGGTLNNLPADVVKQMGADIVIAVALPSPGEEPAASLVSVADRALTIMVQSNERRNMQLADLVLMPDLKGLGSADFDRYAEFAARGFSEAARKERFLAALAVSESEWQAYVAERQRRRLPAAFTPRFVEVEGVTGGRSAQLKNRFASFVGVSLDAERMEEELTRVTGLGRYESASYTTARRGSDEGLRITVREKSYGPPILKFLLNLEGSDLDEVRFDVAARLTFVDLGGPYSEWRTDVNLGNPNRISSEYYWRIAGSRAFLAPRSFLTYSQRGFYVGNERVAETSRQEAGAGLDIGFTPDRRGELRFGYEMNRASEFISTGAALVPKVEGIFHLVRAAWTFDELDNPVVPRSGVRSASTVRWLFDGPQVGKGLPILESELTAAVTFSPRYSLLARMSGGTTAGRVAPIAPFRLGGPLRLSPLVVDQLRGQNYYFGSFSLLRAFSDRRLSFLGKTYFSMSYEIGDAFDDLDRSDPFHGGTLGILAETPFGGLFVGGSIGEQGQRKMFFRIGRLF